ncbi:helix-turn-helix domain-containing protein [Ciceribacter azotifigens]|uniref:helix-turn-helix domain-containing protein n=1 Tax=Ciceribacter azotifigens TaxID=2069303 RepID=UPI003A85DDE8
MRYLRTSCFQQARKSLAELVQQRMKELGMSKDEFMQAMGIRSRLALTLLLDGRTNFKMEDCQRLAGVLSCDIGEMVNMHLAQFHTDEVIQLLTKTFPSNTDAASERMTRPRTMIYERLTLELPPEQIG